MSKIDEGGSMPDWDVQEEREESCVDAPVDAEPEECVMHDEDEVDVLVEAFLTSALS